MKNINFLLLAAVSLSFFSCDKNEENPNSSADDLIGTWYEGVNPEALDEGAETVSLTFTADGKIMDVSNWMKYEGTYSFEKGVLSVTHEKAWEKDYNTNNWVELPDSMFSRVPTVMGSPKFLNNGSEMVFRFSDFTMHQDVESAILYYKKGATEPSDIKALKGSWIYFMGPVSDQVVRVAVKFDGNKYDLFIPVWHQRESGTFEYKKGMVIPNPDKWYSRPWEVPDSTFEEYDPKNLELYWTEEKESQKGSIVGPFGFVIDGSEAYGQIVGLPAVYMKQ